MTTHRLLFVLFGSALLTGSVFAQTQAFYRCSGTNILAPDGSVFRMKGNALSCWLNPEGYALRLSAVHLRHLSSPKSIKLRIRELLGETNGVSPKSDLFWSTFHTNFMTRQDIADMAAEGFNTIRVPFNYRLISPEATPGVYSEEGFQVLDKIIQWSKTNGLAVLLDMHACPGGQSDRAEADPEHTYWDWDPQVTNWTERGVACLWKDDPYYYAETGRTAESNKQRTADIWRQIASRYKNEKAVLGYELINESCLPWDVPVSDSRGLHVRITTAIRQVDINHIIFFDAPLPPWDSNSALCFHKYWMTNSYTEIQSVVTTARQYGIPLCMTESGENSNPWFYEFRRLLETNNVGWCWWGWKKVDLITSALVVTTTPDYRYVIYNFRDTPVDSNRVMKGLMECASNAATARCLFDPGWYDALFSTQFNARPVPLVTHTLPGTIHCVNYDVGNEGVAYHDTRSKNTEGWKGPPYNEGNVYRNDGVDIWTNNDAHPASIQYHVGLTTNGEWMKYTANVPTGGNYRLAFRVATFGSQIRLLDGTNNLVGPLWITNTGGIGIWKTQTNNARTYLSSGNHTLDLRIVTAGVDLGWIESYLYPSIITNGQLTGSGAQPTNWLGWNPGYQYADTGLYRSAPNSWAFWYDGGIYQDRTSGFAVGDRLTFGGWFYTPSWDRLRNGTKHGIIQLEFYNNYTWLSTASSPTINQYSPANAWTNVEAVVLVPANTTKVRLVVRSNNGNSGAGRFFVDDVYVR